MADEQELMLAHNVYFTLEDNSAGAVRKLVDACHKYLKKHPGIVSFAAGTLAADLDRPVNDLGFHVGLHIIFQNRKFHDEYMGAEQHLRFIKENKDNWKQARVFDSYVQC